MNCAGWVPESSEVESPHHLVIKKSIMILKMHLFSIYSLPPVHLFIFSFILMVNITRTEGFFPRCFATAPQVLRIDPGTQQVLSKYFYSIWIGLDWVGAYLSNVCHCISNMATHTCMCLMTIIFNGQSVCALSLLLKSAPSGWCGQSKPWLSGEELRVGKVSSSRWWRRDGRRLARRQVPRGPSLVSC